MRAGHATSRRYYSAAGVGRPVDAPATDTQTGVRYTCATLLLEQRVNPKVVSEMLGHSSVSITLDVYSHVLPDMQLDAAAAIAVALGW
jgi:integrase